MTFVKNVLKGSVVLSGVILLAAGLIWIFACGQ